MGPSQKPAKKLLDQVRETLRLRHYSRATEKTYVLGIDQGTDQDIYIGDHAQHRGLGHLRCLRLCFHGRDGLLDLPLDEIRVVALHSLGDLIEDGIIGFC